MTRYPEKERSTLSLSKGAVNAACFELTPPPIATLGHDARLIDSLLHPQAAVIRQLLRRSARQALDGAILIDDEENILQAVKAGVQIQSLFHSGDEIISMQLRQAMPPNTPVYEVARRTCKKLFENEKVSRIFAIAQAPASGGLRSLTTEQRDIVVLDNVSISGNIGAIVRTTAAMGAGGVVLLDADAVDIYDRRLIRASRGYLFAVPVVAATTDELVQLCAGEGIPLVVTAPDASAPVHEIASLPDRIAIAFGGEKEGCSPALMAAAALRVEIPIHPAVQSLNVSAAAAITLYCRYRFNAARGTHSRLGAGKP